MDAQKPADAESPASGADIPDPAGMPGSYSWGKQVFPRLCVVFKLAETFYAGTFTPDVVAQNSFKQASVRQGAENGNTYRHTYLVS